VRRVRRRRRIRLDPGAPAADAERVTVGRHYGEDVAYFVATSPYLQLSKRAKAEAFLSRSVEAAEECRPTLAAYPRVQIEPLAFFYTCLRSLGTLDLPFIEALLSEHSWRGAVWGAWLAILEPAPHLLAAVSEARGRWPHNDWLVKCAIQGASPSPEDDAILRLGARCRELLRDVARPATPLRRAPTEAEVAQMKQEQERVRAAYASGGAEAARAVLPGTLLEFYRQDYPTWAAQQVRNVL
jgi:hypothetical protein